jgi:hypothetical protein
VALLPSERVGFVRMIKGRFVHNIQSNRPTSILTCKILRSLLTVLRSPYSADFREVCIFEPALDVGITTLSGISLSCRDAVTE